MSAFFQPAAPPSVADFRRRYQRRLVPVHFRWVPDGGLGQLTPDALAKRFGNALVPIQRSERLTGDGDGAVEETYEDVRFADFLVGIQSQAEGGYLGQLELESFLPELLAQLRFPSFDTPRRRTNLWIGPAGTCSKFHYDEDENLFWQLYGQKRFILAAPSATDNLYPTNRSWGDGYSPVDPKQPDFDAFPRFAGVTCHEVVLEPGDLLYLPPGWWHDVTSLSVSVSVSRLWWPFPRYLRLILRRELERLGRSWRGKRSTAYGPRSETHNWFSL